MKGSRNNKVLILILFFLPLLVISLCEAANKSSPPPPSTVAATLQIIKQHTTIDGNPINRYDIVQLNGSSGFTANKGQPLNITIQNKTPDWTVLHWHGLIVPNSQDGVPFVTQTPIPPGGQFRYQWVPMQAGTFWVHSHYKTQQQAGMAAPIIIRDPKERQDIQNVILFLQDVAYTDPQESYPQLRKQLMNKQANIRVSTDTSMDMGPAANTAPIEVAMDAYLTNRRTLTDPDIIRVSPAATVHLQVINAATNSNFYIDLGTLVGKLIAVDSEAINPITGSRFQVAQGQRLVIEVVIPDGENFYPILAQAEGTRKLTGLVLATPNAMVTKISPVAQQLAPPFNYDQELSLNASFPLLPHALNKTFTYTMDGNFLSYIWMINKQVWPNVTPSMVKYEDRVELVLNNKTPLAIPFHLHGHLFQVTEIQGQKVKGAMRDTILILPFSTVKVQFDADNYGAWLARGEIPFQSYGGLMTLINYEGYPIPIFKQKDTGIPPTSSQ